MLLTKEMKNAVTITFIVTVVATTCIAVVATTRGTNEVAPTWVTTTCNQFQEVPLGSNQTIAGPLVKETDGTLRGGRANIRPRSRGKGS